MYCPCEHHITQRPQMPSSSAHGDESTRITPSRAPSNCGRGKKQSTDLELRRSHGLIPLPSGSSFKSRCPPAARISPPHKPPPQHRFSSPPTTTIAALSPTSLSLPHTLPLNSSVPEQRGKDQNRHGMWLPYHNLVTPPSQFCHQDATKPRLRRAEEHARIFFS